MLDNEVTLAVDVLNNGTPVDYDFTRFEEYLNRSVYAGENHSLVARDQLSFYRTQPKPNGNFRGTAKCAAKFSTDHVVDGVDGVSQLTVPLIMELSCSIPVGILVADQLVARQRMIALLDNDTFMAKIMNQLMV